MPRAAAAVVVALLLVGAAGFVVLSSQQRMLVHQVWPPWLAAAGAMVAIGSMERRFGSARVARRMRARLSALIERVHGIVAAGDPARRVPVDGDDAVGRLARAINAMLAALEQHAAALRAAARPDEPETRAPSASLADLSHDLRTPLNVILGYTQLLCEEPIAAAHPELCDLLDRIQRAGLQLFTVVQRLLDAVEAAQRRVARS